jgi:hypothetical protein
VRREYSITHLKYEKSLEVDADHNDLCNFGSKSVTYDSVSAFIKEAIQATQRDLFLYPDTSQVSEYVDFEELENDADSRSQHRRPKEASPQRPSMYSNLSQDSVPQSRYNEPLKRAGTSSAATFDMISEVSNFSLKDPKLPCFLPMTHVRNNDFFGRHDVLKKIEESLLPGSHLQTKDGAELKTFGLCGLGGVGKTEIAVEFMFSHRGDFDAIFWVQSDEPTKVAEGFCSIAVGLGLEQPGTIQNQAVSRDLVKRWLTKPLKHYRRPSMPATGEYASWLLILDNVDDPVILKDYWPSGGRGSILITSRDPLAKGRTFRTTGGQILQPFKEEDAAHFLCQLADNDSDNEDEDDSENENEIGNMDEDSRSADPSRISNDALAIARRLGGLPLALIQMAAVISRNDMTYKDFLEYYDREQCVKDFIDFNLGQDTGYEHTLSTVWALDRLSRGASSLLEVISLIDPDRIQEEILEQDSSTVQIEDGRGYPQDPSEYLKARAELIKSSLITRNKIQHIIRVHRLTQDGVRAAMDHKRLQQTFNSAVSLISSVWPFVTIDRRHNITRWEKCDSLVPHILRLKNFYSSFNAPPKTLEPGIKFAKLLNDVGW